MEDIYKDFILNHYQNPRHWGKIDKPSVSTSLYNSACGDRINLSLSVDQDKNITDIKFTASGCAISIASASILFESIIGSKLAGVSKLSGQDVLNKLKINLSPSRVKCALLSLEVLHKAIHLLK